MKGASRWRLVALLVLVGAGLWVTAVLAAPHMPPLRDFDQTFYPAIRYTLAGENPYTAYYEETDQGAPPLFFSPPWLLLILLPFGLFPLAMARVLWLLFLIGVSFASIRLLAPWRVQGLWTLALVVLPWSLIGLLFGQVTPLVLLGALAAIVLVYHFPESWPVALLLSLCFLLMGLKPQLGILLAAPLLFWMVKTRDRRLVGVVLVGSLALLITLLLVPPWLIRQTGEISQTIAPHWQSTLERELTLWQLPPLAAALMAPLARLFVVGVMVAWAWRARGFPPAWWSAWFTAVLIITPYTRAYDGILMLPMLAQMIVYRRWHFLAFVALMGLYILSPNGELGSVVAPLTAWLLFVPWRGTAGEIGDWRLENNQSPISNLSSQLD